MSARTNEGVTIALNVIGSFSPAFRMHDDVSTAHCVLCFTSIRFEQTGVR